MASWLKKQVRSVGKVVKKSAKAFGKGWEAIDDYALPAVGFALGGPAGAAAGSAAARTIGNGRFNAKATLLAGAKGYAGGQLASGLGVTGGKGFDQLGSSAKNLILNPRTALSAAGRRAVPGAPPAAPVGISGVSGVGSEYDDPMMGDSPMASGGGGDPANGAMSGGRQALRRLLSGGKALTLKNVLGGAGKQVAGLGGGGPGGFIKTAAGAALTLDQLKAAKRRRELSDKQLGMSTNIAGELGERGRSLIKGADSLRLPAEGMMLQRLLAGERPSVNPSQFADTLNPYRRRFRGAAA